MRTTQQSITYPQARALAASARQQALVAALREMARGASIADAVAVTGLSTMTVKTLRRDNLPVDPSDRMSVGNRLPDDALPADRWRCVLTPAQVAEALLDTRFEALAPPAVQQLCAAMRADMEAGQ